MKKSNFILKTSFLAVIVFLILATTDKKAGEQAPKIITTQEPARAKGQTDVLQLKCEPIPVVKVAFVGLGMRGIEAVKRFMYIENVEVTALCDIREELIKEAQDILAKNGKKTAKTYTGSADAWKKMCEQENVDLVYNCTHWDLHTPIAVYAMKQGKHVAIEVPAAITLEECWELVNTSEQTRKHCMMLENCCYDFFEMATLNMAQQGVFGEIVHVEGAYIHDLRFLNFKKQEEGGYYDMWRLKHNEKYDGNLYPTHGLGPVCQVLNIHRGDKMNHLVAMSSNQFGMTEYAEEKFGKDSEYAKKNYKKGDMTITLIRTEKGKTMMIQHDITNPRPYSRIHMISGTKGFAQKWPVEGIALDPDAHEFLPKKEMDKMLEKYEHPIVKKVGELAKKVGGHGGMDFIMDYRLIYCLQNGLPLDQDVYDAAEWSSIIALTRISVENNSSPVQVPDFTRGAWNKLQGLKLAE